MQPETMAMVRSFDHLNRRTEDSRVTTLYTDMGWSGTRLAIALAKAGGMGIIQANQAIIRSNDLQIFMGWCDGTGNRKKAVA